MSASAAAQPRATPARRRPPRPAPRPRTRRHVSSGVAWIVVFGLLLAGVVAVNVAVLQSNIRLDKLARERESLRADVAGLQSRVSAAAASPWIQALAAKRLGLQPAPQDKTTYVEIGR